jgi:hypothetical protein
LRRFSPALRLPDSTPPFSRVTFYRRHARPCAGHPRLYSGSSKKKDVDGRDKPGHDGL